jgi:3-dehydroquinate dehydratase II
MKILILNGPNLNLIGQREPEIYGKVSFEESILAWRGEFDAELGYLQSNVEGELINFLQNAGADGIIFNAGGYTHTSVALRDAIASISVPVVEVHLSNITKRETFRHESMLTPVCVGCIFGFGMESYRMAIHYFLNKKG